MGFYNYLLIPFSHALSVVYGIMGWGLFVCVYSGMYMYACMHQCIYITVYHMYVLGVHVSVYVCMYNIYVHDACMSAKLHFLIFLNGLVIPLDPPLVRMHRGNCNLTMADSNYFIICDILFMRSHEARPSSVPPKLEIWGESQHCCPPVKTLEGTVPLCSPMIYATDVK